MSRFYNFGCSNWVTLTTLLLLIAGNNTNHAFVAPTVSNNPLSLVRPNYASKKIPNPNNSLFDTRTSCRTNNKQSSLASHSIVFQFAHHVSSSMVSGLPKSLVLMKDASGPLPSILELDPETKAECLMDISHLLLDVTAFFKFDGKFLNGAQLVGRLSFIMIDFLPGHAFHVEEMTVQLFLLGLSIQKMMPDDDPPTTKTTTQEEEASNNNTQNGRKQQQQQQQQ
jgi:hypothetical protein